MLHQYTALQSAQIHQLLIQFKHQCYTKCSEVKGKDGKMQIRLTPELIAGLLDAECYKNANQNQAITKLIEDYNQ